MRRRGRGKGRRREQKEAFDINLWRPRTLLGKEVKEGRITNISQILSSGKKIMEVEIVDALVPDLQEEILGVGMMQRMHKSGRRIRYRIISVVGNQNGVVGVSTASAREIGPAIRKAMNAAKLDVIEIARGCGSWECGCGRPHTVPYNVSGKRGSVTFTIKPAPRGLGLTAADVPKTILRLAGIKDAWTTSSGETRTTLNFSMSVFETLKQTTRVIIPERTKRQIVVGKESEVSDQASSG
jgi:small subunit ribosomal protein S5